MEGFRQPFSRHISDLVAERAARTPGHESLVTETERLTYAMLESAVARTAGALRTLGVGCGSVVGLLCSNRPDWVIAYAAAARVGARVAAFNTFARRRELGYMIEHSRCEVLIAIPRFRTHDFSEMLLDLIGGSGPAGIRNNSFPALRYLAFLGKVTNSGAFLYLDELVAEAPPVYGGGPTSVADVGLVVYTSGSTARPKAVALRHYEMLENAFHIGERIGLRSDDRVWVPVPLFWSYGGSNALPATMMHGATLVLQEAFEPAGALDLIERERCTVAYTLPNITAALLSHSTFDASRVASLRTGLTIGTPRQIEDAACTLGVRDICNIYGSSETYGNCCVTPHNWALERRRDSQGPPLPGVELRIAARDSDRTLPAGEIGEILVRGYVTPGYLGDQEATDAAFTAEGWYRSGDLGWLDDQGCLHFTARGTEVVKTGGINVAPAEVEDVLRQHDAVSDAAVVGVPDADMGEALAAFVVPADRATVDVQALREHLRASLASYKVPAHFYFVSELPKTDTGKLSRRVLVERVTALPQTPHGRQD